MKITYDPMADAAYLQLAEEIAPGGVTDTHLCEVDGIEGQINLDLDSGGRLVGIEVLGAAKVLPPGLLKLAQTPLEFTGRSK